jgi:hypothetical protein
MPQRCNMEFIRKFHRLFLNLYPKWYWEEYGDELQTVFNLLLEEAARQGGLELARAVLQEFISLPKAIIHEHLRKPRYGLVTQASILEKDDYMKTIPKIEWEELGSWKATLASLLPLWLFFYAFANISVPSLEILEVIVFYLILPVCIVFFLWKGWMTFELLLYSFFPMAIQFFFDDIDSNCKLLLKLLLTLVLSVGIVGYQRSLNRDSVTLAWLSLLLAAIAGWIFVSYAAQNFCG